MSVDHCIKSSCFLALPLQFWISASTFICVCVIPIIHCFWASLSFKSVLRWFPSWLFSKFQRRRSGWEGHHYPPATVSVHSTHSPRIQSCLHPLASLVSEFICAETNEPSASYFVSLLILTELSPFLPPLPPRRAPSNSPFLSISSTASKNNQYYLRVASLDNLRIMGCPFPSYIGMRTSWVTS